MGLHMNNKKGFTLTEILLAVMIVGVIGVALASLTTAASRESGVGRSKMVLRDNLSLAMRQLHLDVQQSNQVLYARGEIDSISSTVPLLVLSSGKMYDDAEDIPGVNTRYITYCFVPGTEEGPLGDGRTLKPTQTGNRKTRDGGVIYRREKSSAPGWSGTTPTCGNPATDSDFKVFLDNVKFITSNYSPKYPSPAFWIPGYRSTPYSRKSTDVEISSHLGSQLHVQVIVELPTSPVINDVIEEIFTLPNGYDN